MAGSLSMCPGLGGRHRAVICCRPLTRHLGFCSLGSLPICSSLDVVLVPRSIRRVSHSPSVSSFQGICVGWFSLLTWERPSRAPSRRATGGPSAALGLVPALVGSGRAPGGAPHWLRRPSASGHRVAGRLALAPAGGNMPRLVLLRRRRFLDWRARFCAGAWGARLLLVPWGSLTRACALGARSRRRCVSRVCAAVGLCERVGLFRPVQWSRSIRYFQCVGWFG